jgi:hypothetical protein
MPYKPPRPYELGSDEHVYELNKTNDSKWRSGWRSGLCLRTGRCRGYPVKCGACFKYSEWREKRNRR